MSRVFTKRVLEQWNWPMRFLRVGFTFSLVCFAAILFRASSLSEASWIATHLTYGWGGLATKLFSPAFVKINVILSQDKMEAIVCVICLLILLSIHWIQRTHSMREILLRQNRWVRWSIYYAAIAGLLFFGAFNKSQQFIYVQF